MADENGRKHWLGILSGQISTACLANGMTEADAAETAAVVLVKVIEKHGWEVIPPAEFYDPCVRCNPDHQHNDLCEQDEIGDWWHPAFPPGEGQ